MKFKRLHKNAIKPTKATLGSTGYDVYPTSKVILHPNQYVKVPLGFALGIPYGIDAVLRPRSSFAKKGIHVFTGTIDSDYTGEISVQLWNLTDNQIILPPHSAIAQLVFTKVEEFSFIEVSKLDTTDRGNNGFGSTDNVLKEK